MGAGAGAVVPGGSPACIRQWPVSADEMKKTLFERTVRTLSRRPRLIAAALIAGTGLAALGLLRVPMEGMLETMLPERSEALRTVSFLRDADFAGTVALSIEIDPDSVTTAQLTAWMDLLADRIEKSPLVEASVRFPGGGRMMGDMLFFIERSGELLGGELIDKLHGRISGDEIRRLMRVWYGRLARPEGGMMVEMLRRDPLDIGSSVLGRVEELSRSFGYNARIENGHLLHPDGRAGLLLFETGVSVTDTAGSRRLVEFLDEALAGLPDGFSAHVIAGHSHSVSNENVLRADIRRTVIIATAGFLVLFLGIFRDPRAVILFLLPAASVIFALNLSALLLGSLSYIVIGFGAVMAGIAVDYGIHIYVSMRLCSDPYLAVRRILKPVIVGALTTLGVFAAFFASTVPGYRQLGVFAVISIALSILAAVFFLPALLKTGGKDLPGPAGVRGRRSETGKVVISAFFLLSLPAGALMLRGLKVETAVTQLDGTERHILDAESRFRRLWAGADAGQAIAVVSGSDYEAAAEENERLYRMLQLHFEGETFSNLSMLWPAPSARRRNLELWSDFWTPERVEETMRRLREAGRDYGFTGDAFSPFLDSVERRDTGAMRPLDNAVFAKLEGRFVQQYEGGYRFMTFFPDTREANAAVADAIAGFDGAFIASPGALGRALSDSIGAEVQRISAIALALIAVIVLVLMRGIRLSAAALLPAVTGVVWLFAVMASFGLALDIANMIAGIVVVGLCIDYGIFMVHGRTAGPDVMRSVRRSITLSAVTTLMGAGVLIFAAHPALFSIGLTLVIGVTAGYLAAMLGVPGVCVLLGVKSAG